MASLNEDEIRQRVEKRFKKRQDFYVHIAMYVAVNALLWGIWAITGAAFPWPIFVTLGWGIGVVADAVETYFKTSVNVERRKADAIQREIERERERLMLSGEKPKRDQQVSLSDDGELVYGEDEPARDTRRRK